MPEGIYCANCGVIENLVEHHVSYIPERTEVLCKACDAKARRHPPSDGIIPILKTYPTRGTVYFPKHILRQLGELIRFYPAPVTPIGVVFPYKMPLDEVEKSLLIVLDDIRLRMGKGSVKGSE